MAWSGEHRAFAIEQFIENGGSIITTQRAFRVHFALGRHAPVPHPDTIKTWVANFRQTGSALRKKSTGRPRTVTTPENVAIARASIERSPSRSARKHALALRLSDRSIRRIFHRELNLHPYKMVVAQELAERDFETRMNLSRDLREIPVNDVVLFTDEAHFHLSGMVNKQNFRYWAAENPREIHERPLHSPKVTVWCAVSSLGVWGPYFFEENEATVTVNSERYCAMLENFLRPRLDDLFNEHGQEHVWFQQDGATAHTSRRSLGILREMFPGRLISLRGDVGWPPRSPDLTPCDFFLWGYPVPVLGRCERCDRTGRHQEGGAKMNQNVRQKTLDRESRDTRTKKLRGSGLRGDISSVTCFTTQALSIDLSSCSNARECLRFIYFLIFLLVFYCMYFLYFC